MVLETASWQVVFQDAEPDGDSDNGWIEWAPDGSMMTVGLGPHLRIYETEPWRPIVEVDSLAERIPHHVWSNCGRFVITRGPRTLSVFSTGSWDQVATVSWVQDDTTNWYGLAAHPALPLVASLAEGTVQVWELEPDVLLRQRRRKTTERYTTAKVVLVGDSGAGKTGLGYRLATGEFKEHESTHGQHFWLADELATRRADGTECEVVLWDLAGQRDYRITHVLHLDDVDAGLIVFDPSRGANALDAVRFWTETLRRGRDTLCPAVLVAARVDRGTPPMTESELQEFADELGIAGGFVATSASESIGLETLVARLRAAIAWDDMTATVTTAAFRAMKERVLELKQASSAGEPPFMTGAELVERIADGASEAELWVAARNLEVHGYVRVLRTAAGVRVVLLKPELLNNVAASLVQIARANERGLGAIDEKATLGDPRRISDLVALRDEHAHSLLESAIALLLKHNVCFRETLGDRGLLIFPELINEKPPALADDAGLEPGVTYVAEGSVENVYASLVVLLGYTNVLVRGNQWQDRAEYELDGQRVGFKQSRTSPERLELALYGEPGSGQALFQGLIEQFLRRRSVSARRYPRITCSKCREVLDAQQVIKFVDRGDGQVFCPADGTRIELPRAADPVTLTPAEAEVVREESVVARQRTTLSVALKRLRSYVADRGIDRAPSCFVSYAWGDPAHERWIRHTLARDLREADIDLVLDVWETDFGDSIGRFIDRLDKADYVLVVGTPPYLDKYEDLDEDRGKVVAAEMDRIHTRLQGTEAVKRTVIPALREGTNETSLPAVFHGRLRADFTDDSTYFVTVFSLARYLWGLDEDDEVVAELTASLRQ